MQKIQLKVRKMLFLYVPSGTFETEYTTEIRENADILRALRRFRDKEYNCDKKV